MAGENYYIGTDLKFKIEIKADGFDQAVDSYRLDIYGGGGQCGANSHIVLTQEDIIEINGEYFFLLETKKLCPGMLRLVVTAFVPDSDFPSGFRREVTTQNLAFIKSIM